MIQAISVPLRVAHDFVRVHHRHSKPLPEWQSRMQDIAAVGAVEADGVLVGVAILARPVSASIPPQVAEVSRLCTTGTHNACSFLYSRAASRR